MVTSFKGLELLAVPQERIDAVAELVDRYRRNRDQYRGASYNEARLRQEFLNPFFTALGWDMDNSRGHSEAYKDVIHEDVVRVEGVAKAPDYCFRYGGQRKFYVEAKAPAVNIKNDTSPAYQLRRYGWSAKLPLSVLTDFEEFAVYDCRQKPGPTDPPAFARVLYLTCEEYLDNLQVLYSVFGYEAIPKGFFDRYAEAGKGKKGTATVDAEFLKEIERWRDELARHIAARNDLSVYELNYAVQTIIDRILFLRIAEDRGIEPANRLKESAKRADVYGDLCTLFHAADDKYNSGLFNFDKNGDQCTPHLRIENKVLKDIIASLYYPRSPYEFSVIGADILGAVYEQFLGKVIRLTKGGYAKVEEKPEVKKAGGVYYTPRYIVDYIVEHTVGEAVREAGTPEKVAKLRVLDPACGSGSFLLGAYDWLLNWHLEYYTAHEPEKQRKARKPVLVESKGDWRLSTQERKRILQANLYGVDIDAQAVEVTKLNLLLKCLEGETEQTLETQQQMFRERVLPNIDGNIKCGNSLIGPDYYTGRLDYDPDERRRVNAFDWGRQFKETMGAGGFDCVIGNPPYVRPHNMTDDAKGYFWDHYSSFVRKADIYCCFIEKALQLLRPDGLFGYIVSNGWLRLDSFENLRKLVLKQSTPLQLIDFTGKVFSQATVNTMLFILRKGASDALDVSVATVAGTPNLDDLVLHHLPLQLFGSSYKSIFDLRENATSVGLKSKMRAGGLPLGDTHDICFGLKTADDETFLGFKSKGEYSKPLLRGADVQRYRVEYRGEYVHYLPLAMRERNATARPGTAERFEQPKVLIRDTGGSLFGTFDPACYYVKDVLIVETKKIGSRLDLRYLTGLLNSALLSFYYNTSFPTLHVQRDELASLPIRPIDFSNPSDVARHDKMVSLVQTMLDLNERLPKAKTPRERDLIERQIADTDEAIDQLVYELYDLTPEEIEIVRGH